MLGAFNGIHYPNSVYNGLHSIQHVNKLVAWWDFTDIDKLYQTRTSYNTAVSSDGDLIGRCVNKAAPTPAGHAHEYGLFIRADQASDRPTYKTGGANGHSYALFNGSDTGLACRSESQDWGAHTTDVLSTWPVVNTALDIWIIGEPADNDSDGVRECALSYFGYRGDDTDYADADQSTLFAFQREDDEDTEARWIISGAPTSPNLIVASQPFSHWNSGETTIINMAGRSGIGASHIYTNNTPDVGQTIFDTNFAIEEPLRQQGYIVLNNSDWDDTKVASFGIGAQVNSAGELTANFFEGKIYEILVYSLNVPNDSERNAIASHFMTKYGIT